MRNTSVLIFLTLLFLTIIWTCRESQNQRVRWTEEQAAQWAQETGWLRGSNFIPSNAINQLDMWQADSYDTVTINRELGYAESLGFNVMRVYLHHKAWKTDPVGFKNRVDNYLALSSKHRIKTLLVFFDDCWNKESAIGKQPDPKPGIHNSGWVQDPGGRESSDSTYFPLMEQYVKDVMNYFAKDERIVMWDLYNEPGNSGKGDSSLNLLVKVFTWARETRVTQPITSAVWNNGLTNLNKIQLENSDIITFHNYGRDSSMTAEIEFLRKYNRPLVCSEYMARSNGSRFENILPLLKKEKIGSINWGLVSGKTNTIYKWGDTTHLDGSEPDLWFHDIFRKDGSPYLQEEVDLIRRECLNR